MPKGYRVADGRFPLWDGRGAELRGGRWNGAGKSVIYLAGSYAGALLENLIRLGWGKVPGHTVVGVAEWEDGVEVERIDAKRLPRQWAGDDLAATQRVGNDWLERGETAILDVPSVVGRPHERTLVLNPEHRDFPRLALGKGQKVEWDPRLFARDGE